MAYGFPFTLPRGGYVPPAPAGHAEGDILWVAYSDGSLRPVLRGDSFVSAFRASNCSSGSSSAPSSSSTPAATKDVEKAIEAAVKAKAAAVKARTDADEAAEKWARMIKKSDEEKEKKEQEKEKPATRIPDGWISIYKHDGGFYKISSPKQ